MIRFLTLLLVSFFSLATQAQMAPAESLAPGEGIVKGRVLDKNTNMPLEFINIRITALTDTTKMAAGAITDTEGRFNISGLADGDYEVTASFVGYRTVSRRFSINGRNRSSSHTLYMKEDATQLQEVQVTGIKSSMKLEVDRKSFDVSQLITNSGDAASDVLDNIPSVEVDNEGNISLRGNTSVEVWINGKASGLTSDNRAEILQQLPAESIDHIEVIDNPSAKFSAEGSAGIINIVLKKDRKPGYYGSVQAGADTKGGANSSFNINYSSPRWDAYANVGYRHRKDEGHSESDQHYLNNNQYQRYSADNNNQGNNIFSRAGLTFHATDKDDISFNGMLMQGKHKNSNITPYHYGNLTTGLESYMMMRQTHGEGDMNMYYGEFDYKHSFSDKHTLDLVVNFNRWKSDNENIYQDSTTYLQDVNGTGIPDTEYSFQSRPMHMNNRTWEVKLDYENQITDLFKLQAGYQGRFSHENTPQESFVDNAHWNGSNMVEDQAFYNRFIYDMDVHAGYITAQYKLGKLGIMAGLRGEYWKVNTESYTYEQEHNAALRDKPFKKDYFELFPSLFMSYEITPNDQLQLNYTRRLRRPWGGQLNSFRDTRDATMVSFGNPELTPEFSNSFSLNYLKTWNQHSMMISAYYRPTTDVMQRINWQSSTDNMMYSTTFNVAKSQSSGLEATVKNRFFKRLDLTTTANAYYYKLNGFSYNIDNQIVTGAENSNFTWNARMTASIALPYDISIQTTGRYRSRESIVQGYRKANVALDMGIRKNFFNKMFTLAISCRDVLDSRCRESYTSSDTFTRYQKNRWGGRKVNFTLTWNFGNMKSKKRPDGEGNMMNNEENETIGSAYEM